MQRVTKAEKEISLEQSWLGKDQEETTKLKREISLLKEENLRLKQEMKDSHSTMSHGSSQAKAAESGKIELDEARRGLKMLKAQLSESL